MSPSYASVRRISRLLTVVAVCLAASAAPIARVAPVARKGTVVRGVVWNSDNSPVPNAKVRLRNLHSGRVEAHAVSTETGQFVFTNIEGGAYVVELVGGDGKVIAVGQSFRVEAGETIATFVRLAARPSWFAGAFSNTAAAVISAASSAGITALGSQARPVSPQ